MRARWRRELDQKERADEQRPIGGALPVQVARGAPWAESTASLAPIDATTPIVIGSKVRRIDEPYVVLHVRELDVEGKIDGTGKVLCFNSFGAGKWMRIDELEVLPS